MTFTAELHLTTPNMKGDAVKQAQTLLIRGGYLKGKVDGEWGPLCGAATARAKWALGYTKGQCNQIFGPNLFKYLSGEKLPALYAWRAKKRKAAAAKPKAAPLREQALQLCLKDVGMHEVPDGSNRCPVTEQWGVIGAWCAMTWSLYNMKVGLGKKLGTFSKVTHYMYVPSIAADARAGRNGLYVLHPDEVQPGDGVCYAFNGKGTLEDHVGRFKEWTDKAAGTFKSLDGNTSGTNPQDGGMLAVMDRNVSEVSCFVRVAE